MPRRRVRTAERRARLTLREFADAIPPWAGVTVAMQKVHGDPVDVLTAYGQSHEMQFIACGWHEHALPERTFAESSTAALLHRASCAVLVAPQPPGGEHDDAG